MPQKPQVMAFVQARMSSKRFPGKVLADLNGRPVIDWVIAHIAEAMPREAIVVATSREPSDDVLARHLEQSGIKVFRGPLQNVFERFQLCLKEHPADWFFRVCADSPFLSAKLLKYMLGYKRHSNVDLVTNTLPRTFPVGLSLEMVSAKTFSNIDAKSLSPQEQEHLTTVFYNHPQNFRIVNIESRNPGLAAINFSLDTPEDLSSIKKFMAGERSFPEIEIKENLH